MRHTRNIYNPEGRPTCYSCIRPVSHCVCGLIEPFHAHANILILQHPHERKKYYGTAKLVTKAIYNSRLLRGIQFDEDYFSKILKDQSAYLLYPSKDAIDCQSVELDSDSTVIVLDGTWDEAGKILHRNQFLKKLPCLTFKAGFESNYKIRKQPRKNYLSTIESIAYLLKLNAECSGVTEQSKLYDSLFQGFSKMIDKQAAYVPRLSQEISKYSCSGSQQPLA